MKRIIFLLSVILFSTSIFAQETEVLENSEITETSGLIEETQEEIKEYLSNDQFKLYNLIYNRFIASQMAQAIYDTISIDIKANDYLFKATGSKINFEGFMAVYIEKLDDEEEKRIASEALKYGLRAIYGLEIKA